MDWISISSQKDLSTKTRNCGLGPYFEHFACKSRFMLILLILLVFEKRARSALISELMSLCMPWCLRLFKEPSLAGFSLHRWAISYDLSNADLCKICINDAHISQINTLCYFQHLVLFLIIFLTISCKHA